MIALKGVVKRTKFEIPDSLFTCFVSHNNDGYLVICSLDIRKWDSSFFVKGIQSNVGKLEKFYVRVKASISDIT